jgi:hypothetical protein
LEQGVYASHEQYRLNHPGFLFLAESVKYHSGVPYGRY